MSNSTHVQFPQQLGGWGKALLIMQNRQFAVYLDSSAISPSAVPSSAEMVPPTATKIRTLSHSKQPHLLSVINH